MEEEEVEEEVVELETLFGGPSEVAVVAPPPFPPKEDVLDLRKKCGGGICDPELAVAFKCALMCALTWAWLCASLGV